MAVLSVNGAGKDFGDNTILESVSFEVQPGERVGLVGDNGTGKTTLLKMISGKYRCDRGSIHIASSVRVGVLDQIPEYPDGVTVERVLRTAFDEFTELRRKMEKLESLMSQGDDSVLREYGELAAAYEGLGGYDVEVELKRVANGLGIANMLASEFNRLSGGERTRINLARMILLNVDLMLLDEPTNHLDIASLEWLEEYLTDEYKGAAVIISHDRYFLDRTVSRIVEIEEKTCRVWQGNYSAYAYQKAEWLKSAEARIRQSERKIKQLEDTARRFHAMNMEKLHVRAFNMERRAERIRKEMPHIVKQGRNLRASFGSARRPGEDILTVTGLSKSFGDRTLFSDVDLEIKKDDRIGLIGANGAGKTTLLRILLGSETPDCGRIKWGVGVKHAYLPQMVSFDNPHATLVDTVARSLRVTEGTARSMLGTFNFSGDDVFKRVCDLSGGEKSRLRLCILMQNGVNMLILDEPTNHLDIRSRDWIENAIDAFDGTLLLVSHDRYFLEKFATRIWSVERGGIVVFDGGYNEYRAYAEMLEDERQRQPETEKMPERKTSAPTEQPPKRNRESDALRKRVPIIERDIERLEKRSAEIDAEMEANSSDAELLEKLMLDKEECSQKLDELLGEWAELMEKL